jgi:hypothetical protein
MPPKDKELAAGNNRAKASPDLKIPVQAGAKEILNVEF